MEQQLNGFLRELDPRPSDPVAYRVVTDAADAEITAWVGRRIAIEFTGERACIHCGRRVKKLFNQGYCYPCFTTLAECDLCIVKPHECHFHKGTCRDEGFAAEHCMIPHYVYLAYSSGVKVGLTRKGRELKRWMDQGAVAAVLLAEVPTRKIAGELEMEIAKHLPDKTDWRRMLRAWGEPDVDLAAVREEVASRLPAVWQRHLLAPAQVRRFHYPRGAAEEPNLTALSLDKQPRVEGTVTAIKGQYLLLDCGVLNVKRHAGYHVQISLES
ncbi:DUF2797 domain-containing protein [Alicyclobacillus sp.]|uniref:DUF2797 domain-containing protein n=1 Tax=Alicyclobacillus sp. TaxID=61169 RepID=UPI0025B96675|nr:DUF2797 domain-containing protein [Alicyclobacillus sp.]